MGAEYACCDFQSHQRDFNSQFPLILIGTMHPNPLGGMEYISHYAGTSENRILVIHT